MPSRPNSEETQAAILDAAIAIAGGQGAAAVTHRSVAKLAGVAVGSITYHFSSTDQLLEAALTRAGDRERRRVRDSRPTDQSDPEAWVDGLVEHLVVKDDGDRERKLAAFELMLEAGRRESLRAELGAWQAEYLHTTTAALAAAGSSDPAADAPLLLTALLGLDLAQLSAGGFPTEVLRVAISAFVRRLVEG